MADMDKKNITVRGQQMAYLEAGSGDPILFLHGNPTSSYLWRNILPELAPLGRCIAPDLIGMGDSAKLPDSAADKYSFATHSNFLDALLSELGIHANVTLVVHDWGSALGFDWARRHPNAVKGVAYMEAIVRPLTWEEWPAPSRSVFQAMRSEAGEQLVLEKNLFVEKILPASIQRDLSVAEMAEYRRPFAQAGEDRRPTLDWPRQLPIDNEPPELCERVQQYADWMSQTNTPKLFINAKPGAILVGQQRVFCRTWPNQTEVLVNGIHFIQEDSPKQIAQALTNWYNSL
jgi:haloalkane dehalogenase